MKLPLWEEEKNFFKIGLPTLIEALFTEPKDKKDKEKWAEHYLKEIERKTRKTRETKRKPIPASLRHEVFKRDDYTCQECGNTRKETALEVDHIVPVSQRGTDELDNLRTLCLRCNRDKGNRSW